MENGTYTTITRQSGLMREMALVANNIANASTTGYRTEGLVFAEHVRALEGGHPSVSMATGTVRRMNETQGAMTMTGGTFDLAIEGPGYFLVGTPDGPRLTRAGHFSPNGEGDLVTPDGYPVLDAGGAPVFVPTGVGSIGIAPDGTLSADGQPVAQVGLVVPDEGVDLIREGSTRFRPEGGYGPTEEGRILQGHLEGSNVDPILEVARMIEVQRAYELGQSFLDMEDERIRGAVETLGRRT